MQTELKKVEANFLKEYNKPREDLKLEDLKVRYEILVCNGL